MLEKEIQELVDQQSGNISYVIRLGDDVLKYRESETYYPASTVKVPNAMANMLAFKNELDKMIPVENPVDGCGVLHTLGHTKEITLYDAIVLSIIISDNTAANMVIDHIGVKDLNEYYQKFGMKDSYLRGKYYDFDNKDRRNSTVTADDLYQVMQLLTEENDVFPTHLRERLLGIMKRQQFNDRIGGFLVNQDDGKREFYIASKTGSVNNLEHDFGVISYEGNTVTFAVCSDGWQSNVEARKFLMELGNIFHKYLSK